MLRKKLALTALLLLHASFTPGKKQDLNVVFIGDSITHGTGPKDQSPPIFAGEYLRKLARFTKVEIANQGVSGYTTVDFLPATDKSYKKVRAVADIFAADKNALLIFSIMLGTNDSAIKGPNGSPVSPADYHKNLELLSDSLLNAYPDSKIVINYPIWYSANTQNRGAAYLQEGLDRVRHYYAEINALVKSHEKSSPKHIFLGDTKGVRYFEKNHLALFKPEIGPVGNGTFYLHPNREGDIALGTLWGKAVQKALGK